MADFGEYLPTDVRLANGLDGMLAHDAWPTCGRRSTRMRSNGAARPATRSSLYGSDVLVAPVVEAGARRWKTYLPAGARWVHAWSGAEHAGGADVEVDAPFGQPPVFYRADSRHRALFAALAEL